MSSKIDNRGCRIAGTTTTVLVAALLTGCGGARVLDEPVPVERIGALAEASDQNIEAALDWVVVRDGPGTWVRNADWDEYRFQITNSGNRPIVVERLVVYDLQDASAAASDSRKELVRQSKQVARRYDMEGVVVKAGAGTHVFVAAGAVSTAVVAGTVAAGPLAMSTAAAGVATVGLVLTPVFIAGGIMRGMNNGRVSREIEARSTTLPFEIAPGETRAITRFYPLTPSPGRVEVRYAIAGSASVLVLGVADVLKGLHIAEPVDEVGTVADNRSQ